MKKNRGRGKTIDTKVEENHEMKVENPLIVSMIAKENQNKPKSK